MTRRRRRRDPAPCLTGRRGYASRGTARRALNALRHLPGHSETYLWHCPSCNCWHLTDLTGGTPA